MFERRLSLFLARFASPLALGACALGPLDDEYCHILDAGDTECPSAEEAAVEFVGRETCESPVRKVVRVGDFLYSEEFEPSDFTYGPRDTGGEPVRLTQCCYEARYRTKPGSGCVIGRPLLDGGEPVMATGVGRADWCGPVTPDAEALARLSPAAREALAEAWAETGLLEHASVPAFARLVLELTALGAPADLVARAGEAMADEIRHAEAAFALASAFAGRPVGPGPLAAPPLGAPDLVNLAVATFREGCVGETTAVAVAAAQRQGVTDAAVRHVLDTIVADEARHAALAWDVVRWALAAGGDAVRTALNVELAALSTTRPEAGLLPRGCAEFGLATPALVAVAMQGALHQVVEPEARALLAA